MSESPLNARPLGSDTRSAVAECRPKPRNFHTEGCLYVLDVFVIVQNVSPEILMVLRNQYEKIADRVRSEKWKAFAESGDPVLASCPPAIPLHTGVGC